jgi:DNA repair protein RecO (recombination protein O)
LGILVYICFLAKNMLYKTRGIVLSFVRYGDSSIIVRIYTAQLGLQSYIVNGVRSAKSKSGKIALYQPLTLLDLVVYYEPEKQKIFRINEARCATAYHSIPFDIRKTTIALFLAEVLSKTLKEETANESLYDFIEQSFLYFDQVEQNFDDFHFLFLLRFSGYLGFAPSNATEIFSQLREANRLHISKAHEEPITDWLEVTLQTDAHTQLAYAWRGELLDVLVDFYGLHIEGMQHLKSLEVLREISK